MIIHLNGRAGVGKLTVARLLAQKLNARVVDNHAVIDLVRTLTERRTPEYFSMIHKTMDLVFDELAARSAGTNVVFTNWLSAKHEEDRKRLDNIAAFAEKHQMPFIQIFFDCALEENKRRIVSEGRKEARKLTDPVLLEEYHKTSDIYHPDRLYRLTIDTTNMQPEEVAGKVLEYLRSHALIKEIV